MRIVMQHRVSGLISVGLVALISMLSACADKGKYSSDDVMVAFVEIAKNQTISDAEREKYFRFWFPQITIGKVKHIEADIYEVRFADISWEGEEVWGIDMSRSRIQPVNGVALMSAIYLFCLDREDQSADCELWIRQLQDMAEANK